jgi:hypothetical protein
MNIKLNKDSFIKKFLIPASRIGNECIISLTNDFIQTVLQDQGKGIFFYSKIKASTGVAAGSTAKLNVKDIRKLIRIIECISEDNIELELDDNFSVLKYKSPGMSFKMHLVTDSVIARLTTSVDKLNGITWNTDFILAQDKLTEVLKGCTFATDSNKIYIFTKDKKLYGELNDKTTTNIDSVTYIVSESYTGDEITTAVPVDMEFFRILSSSIKEDIKIKINSINKILLFEVINDECVTKYFVQAFVK